MIRPATLADVEAIWRIANFETRIYKELKPDTKKIRDGIIQAISSARHFAWVSVDVHNDVQGALVGLTSNNLWAQRKNCVVALWSSYIVGDGAKLLREFKRWVQSRRVIRVAGLVPDSNNIDQRSYDLAGRIGFQRCGGAYLLYN